MKYRIFIIVVIASLLLLNCEKDAEIQSKNYPRVITYNVDNIDTSGVTLTGEILYSNSNEIVEYGFVWGTDRKPTINNYKYTFEDAGFVGKYDKHITFDLPTNTTLNVRAYAKTESYVIYGNEQTFTSEGASMHTIKSFSPVSGTDGAIIKIEGTNFSSIKDRIKITIGDKVAIVDSVNHNRIFTRLPASIRKGSYKIVVEIDQKTARSKTEFKVQSPVIKSFYPEKGFDETKIEIIGEFFSNEQNGMEVTVGNIPAKIIRFKKDTIVIRSPKTQFVGDVNITINVGGKKVVSQKTFNILGPTIEKIDPPNSTQNSFIDLHGYYFSENPKENTVYIGELKVDVIKASPYLLKVKVPDMYGGDFDVSIKVGNKKNTFPGKFTVNNAWSAVRSLGSSGRIDAVGFSIGDKGYVGTGRLSSMPSGPDNNWKVYDDFWEYDPLTNLWSRLKSFPGGNRCFATGFSIGDKGYVGTGYDGSFNADSYNDFWEYNPANDSWVQKSDFPGDPRRGALGFSVGGKGYIGFGYHDMHGSTYHYEHDMWEYDPSTDSWTEIPAMDKDMVNARVFVLNNKAYIVYGTELWVFDPDTYTWKQKLNFRGHGFEGVAFAIDNKGYVGTGYTETGYYASEFWEYDPEEDKWTPLPIHYKLYRYKATGFSIGKAGYLGEGLIRENDGSNGYHGDYYKFDPYK